MKLEVSTVGHGKDLVFIHGWGVNSGVWEPLIPRLARRYRVTTIDIPGYGKNVAQLPQPYDLENIAKTIALHLPENSVLVGWSLGGLIAKQIALTFPDKLAHLILVCSSPKFSKSDDWHGIEENVLAFFATQLEQDFSKTLARFLAIQAMGSDSAKDDIKQLKSRIEQYPQPTKEALSVGLDMLKGIDLRSELSGLSMPCNLMLGRLDSLVPIKMHEALLKLVPHIQVDVFEKASHAPFISHTDAFIERLVEIVE